MRKKALWLFLVVSLLLTSLCGCMSEEQRKKAAENLAAAVDDVKAYLAEYYPDAKIKRMETLTRVSGISFAVSINATELVEAEVTLADGSSMNVICDIGSGKCYDDGSAEILIESVKKRLSSTCAIENPEKIVVWFFSSELTDAGVDPQKIMNFAGKTAVSAEALLTDEYYVYADCKYDAADIDLGKIDLSPFFTKSIAKVTLINYVSGRFDMDTDRIFSASEVASASMETSYSQSKPSLVVTDFNYSRAEMNGIEFAWENSCFDVKLSEETAPTPVVTKYYSGKPFHSVDGKLVRFDITRLGDKGGNIYFYFGTERCKNYVLVENGGYYDCWRLEWKKDDFIYRWYSFPQKETSQSLTIGYYEM